MLQAYFDESEKGELFVMAGYLSSDDGWLKFSKEWGEKLKLIKAPAFKMKNMNKTDKYRRLSGEFYKIIEERAILSVGCVVNSSNLRTAVDSMTVIGDLHPDRVKQLKNPYHIAFKAVVSGLLKNQAAFGFDYVNFVFDQRNDNRVLREGWDDFIGRGGKEISKLVKSEPRWEDDKKVLPLQAADLLAYWIRDWEQKGIKWQEKLPFPWGQKNNFPGVHLTVDVEGYIADLDRKIKNSPDFRACLSEEQSSSLSV